MVGMPADTSKVERCSIVAYVPNYTPKPSSISSPCLSEARHISPCLLVSLSPNPAADLAEPIPSNKEPMGFSSPDSLRRARLSGA